MLQLLICSKFLMELIDAIYLLDEGEGSWLVEARWKFIEYMFVDGCR